MLINNQDVSIIFDLREINIYGVMSGIEKNFAKELFAYILEKPEYQNFGYYENKFFFGGEKISDFDERIYNAIMGYVAILGLMTLLPLSHTEALLGVYSKTY